MTEKELQNFLLENYPEENESCDWKEMKNLKNSFDGKAGDDVISYVSAFSNMEGGVLIIGVKDGTLEIVGTDTHNYNKQQAMLRLKERCTNLPIEKLRIDEYITEDTNKKVWIIHIPKHQPMLPVYAHSKPWQRLNDSLIPMTKSRLEIILAERLAMNDDWSAVIIDDATLDDLDSEAINMAREGYKQRYPNLSEICDTWNDLTFLDKACLTIGGKITRTTLLLVGKKESAYKLKHIAELVWKCFQDGEIFGDIFTIPLIKATTSLLSRIRNYRFKIYPQNSLIPGEVWKYDTRSILEALHNCIAHQDYTKNERIILTETKDKLKFENAGVFFDGTFEEYVSGERTPRSYRNPFLMKAMVNVKMIDSQGYGIHNLFVRQKERYLPMPDYEDSDSSHVIVNLPGTVIDVNYSLMLLMHNDISLVEAVLLDQLQKGKLINDKAIDLLRKKHLIEGRKPHVYIAKKVAQSTDKKVAYSKHKGLEKKSCEAMLLNALRDHGFLNRSEIDQLLNNVLSDQLSPRQKKSKIGNILTRLRKQGFLSNDTRGNFSIWTLVKNEN